jgi:nucleotide-binding universal stress UspA family protein
VFERIVTPLDGSNTAEGALPYARTLAERLGVIVELLEVIDASEISGNVSAATAALINQARTSDMADQYLTEIANRFPRIRTRCRVVQGSAAAIVIDVAAENKETLIIMASHGRSGLHRWLLGSVAEKVLRGTSNPLLLIRTTERIPADGQAAFESIVVPLDGSKPAEAALAKALELARSMKIEIVLMRAYELPATAYYRADDYPSNAAAFIPSHAELVEEMSREAREYLDAKVQEISAHDSVKVRAEIIEGPAAEQIIELAQNIPNSLIATSTHGRSGVSRWILGSVTEKIVHYSHRPVLVVRADD